MTGGGSNLATPPCLPEGPVSALPRRSRASCEGRMSTPPGHSPGGHLGCGQVPAGSLEENPSRPGPRTRAIGDVDDDGQHPRAPPVLFLAGCSRGGASSPSLCAGIVMRRCSSPSGPSQNATMCDIDPMASLSGISPVHDAREGGRRGLPQSAIMCDEHAPLLRRGHS
jgi:hypothetical protein